MSFMFPKKNILRRFLCTIGCNRFICISKQQIFHNSFSNDILLFPDFDVNKNPNKIDSFIDETSLTLLPVYKFCQARSNFFSNFSHDKKSIVIVKEQKKAWIKLNKKQIYYKPPWQLFQFLSRVTDEEISLLTKFVYLFQFSFIRLNIDNPFPYNQISNIYLSIYKLLFCSVSFTFTKKRNFYQKITNS